MTAQKQVTSWEGTSWQDIAQTNGKPTPNRPSKTMMLRVRFANTRKGPDCIFTIRGIMEHVLTSRLNKGHVCRIL